MVRTTENTGLVNNNYWLKLGKPDVCDATVLSNRNFIFIVPILIYLNAVISSSEKTRQSGNIHCSNREHTLDIDEQNIFVENLN